MKKKMGWIGFGTKDFHSYHFYVPEDWTIEKRRNKARRNFELIDDLSDFESKNIVQGWLALVGRLPAELYGVLICELRRGNELTDICAVNWPSIGSVVCTLKKSFSAENKKSQFGVAWRNLNDAHYCNEEICQNVDGIEYLLIF